MTKTEHGTLLIADITGYTMYLPQSKLEHAQEVLTVLFRLLLDHTRPPLPVSHTARDGESTYLAFRRAFDRMVLNNNCKCNACQNIGSPNLKFFVLSGSFTLQRLGEIKVWLQDMQPAWNQKRSERRIGFSPEAAGMAIDASF